PRGSTSGPRPATRPGRVRRPRAPHPARADARARSAAAAGELRPLDQLETRVVGTPEERDPRAVRHLGRPLEEARAQPLEPPDVGLEVLCVEAEVLETPVGAGL